MLTYDLTARGRKTMYEYLYEAMKADILSGRLTAGEKLPSKRAFAEHLQVSVKTVENTYEQLLLGESDYFETLMRDEPESYLELALAYLHNGGKERVFCQPSGSEERLRPSLCILCDPFPGGRISGGSDGQQYSI